MELSMAEMCEMASDELELLFLNVTKAEDGNGTFDEFLSRQTEACEQLQFHQVVSWLVPVIFAVIVVVGVIGNTLVLVVVLFGNQMRNTTNVLILVSRRNSRPTNNHLIKEASSKKSKPSPFEAEGGIYFRRLDNFVNSCCYFQ